MIDINTHIKTIASDIINLRKKLHLIPELKYEELKTSQLIAETLTTYGYKVQTGIAVTGVIAILDSGKPGKTIALRADMDALPIAEPEHFACRSTHPGKMHACGHDGHVATMLAVAYALRQVKDQLCGKIKFIFQPAEEGGKGSTAMIEAGALKAPHVDEIYGYHNWPGLAEGVIATRAGTLLAGNGRIEIVVHGKPAHTAQPEQAINPVIIGAELIIELEKLRKDLKLGETLFNLIAFNSGDFKRGMSSKADIVAVYYTDNENNLLNLKQKLNKLIESIATKYGSSIDISYAPFHSPTINSERESKLVLAIAKKLYGPDKAINLEKSMIAAEDFSEYLKYTPGCFFLVGTGENAGAVHTPSFQFNDNIIIITANIISNIVINSLFSKKHGL